MPRYLSRDSATMPKQLFAVLVLALVAGLVSSGPVAPHDPAVDGRSTLSLQDECAKDDRVCLSFPKDCLPTRNCTMVLTARKDEKSPNNTFIFDMQANFTGYVSFALASTEVMGNDSVVECVRSPASNSSVLLYQSVNIGRNVDARVKRGNRRLPLDEQKGVELLSSSLVDGIISCSVRRHQKTTVAGVSYDLQSGSWYLQLAAGDRVKDTDNKISHHDKWVVSKSKIQLSNANISAPSAFVLLVALSLRLLCK